MNDDDASQAAKPAHTFQPGFRISFGDVAFLIICLGGAAYAAWATGLPWTGFVVAFVVLHFFLFCNVFRIARVPELIWGGIFAALAGSTIVFGKPGWLATSLISLALTVFLLVRETRQPHYHGVGWQRWNPKLPEWWRSRRD